jgi:hypothetical protein
MRLICLALIGGLLVSGCATSQTPSDSSKKPGSTTRKPAAAQSTVSKAAPGKASLSVTNGSSVVTLTDASVGKVASVNALRFVVVDFSLSRLPVIDQRLGVYRQGVKVGEIKVSGPSYYNNIVADIVAGEVKVGDQVRVE